MAEVLSIRDRSVFEARPELAPVRSAMICMHDYMMDAFDSHITVRSVSSINPEALENLASTLGIDMSDGWQSLRQEEWEEMQMVFELVNATRSLCTLYARGIGWFFSCKHRDDFSVQVYGCDESGLKYFYAHDVAVISHKWSGLKVGVSGANILNSNWHLSHVLDVPTYDGQGFQRAETMVLGYSEDEVVRQVAEMEGGDVWERRSHWYMYRACDRFCKIKSDGEVVFVDMLAYIEDWQDDLS